MQALIPLLRNNEEWVRATLEREPDFFDNLASEQHPEYLWIGCSDSRVVANQIIGLLPGQMFVHRNVANLVTHTDLNCLSVIQYAVEVLEIRHIIVCGHYNCGGVIASLKDARMGLIDNWLRRVQDVAQRHAAQLEALESEKARIHRLCELNAIEQVVNTCRTTVVQDAWNRGQFVRVHGWMYEVSDGHIRDLAVSSCSNQELDSRYPAAIANPPPSPTPQT